MRRSNPGDKTIPSRSIDRDERQNSPNPSGGSKIPLRVWAFAVLAAVLLIGLFGFWGLYVLRGRSASAEPTATAIIWTPTPTQTPAIRPTYTLTSTPDTGASDSPTPTPSAAIGIGGYVKVTGTEGYGLSLREGPGPDYTRMDIAAEDEVFIVTEGPRMASGAPWWRIRDVDNEEREWWAVANYLEPVEEP